MEDRNRAELLALAYCKESDDSLFSSDEFPAKGIYDERKVDIWYPINPVTGFPQDEVSGLTNPLLTAQEKEQLISRLGQMRGEFLANGLDDDELFEILPPRYLNNDAVDIASWRQYVEKNVIPYLDVNTDVSNSSSQGSEPEPNGDETASSVDGGTSSAGDSN